MTERAIPQEAGVIGPEAVLLAIQENRRQRLKDRTYTPKTLEERIAEMSRDVSERRRAVTVGEQRPEDVDEVRAGIRAIYESREVKDAVYESWVNSLRPIGSIALRKGIYEFNLQPGSLDNSDGLAPLRITRAEFDELDRVKPETLWTVDASSRDVITGSGIFEIMALYNEFDLEGSEPITVARAILRSFNVPEPLGSAGEVETQLRADLVSDRPLPDHAFRRR